LSPNRTPRGMSEIPIHGMAPFKRMTFSMGSDPAGFVPNPARFRWRPL
jgi:hypothetical protein